jgi:hypothetical protein
MGFSFLARCPRIGEDAPMPGRLPQIVALTACLAAAAHHVAADPSTATPPGPLSAYAARRLDLAIGDPDAATGNRLAALLTSEQIAAAMYHGTRGQRMVAIDAAAHLEDPWPILPYLAGDEIRGAFESVLDARERVEQRGGGL